MAIDAGKIIAYLDMDTSGFTHAFDTASEQLSGFTSGGIEGALGSIGAAATTAGRALTLGVTAPLLGAAGAAVGVGMSFDESMSNVYGLMSSLDLTQDQMDALRDTAREMGATTKFSASEAADAMGYMALAGWDDQQVIAGLPGVLNLAAAANMDLAKASDIVTDTMTPFGMAAEEAARAADVFAYAQANSNTTVEGLGEAMKYVAPSADAFGMTLEDTAAALGTLANAGIKGSQGGTTLNAMLRDMKKNAEDGAIAIGKTKVALTNADGSYRSYGEIIRDIDTATQGMSESQRDAALSAIFGDESIKGVLATLKQGPDALDAMTAGMYAAGGAASSMAATMQDNLKGELTTLSSGVQEMGIALSDFLTPILRQGVGFVTDLVGRFNALDEGTKNMIFRAGALAAAAGPVVMTGGKLLTLLSGVNPLVLGFGAAASLAYTHSETLQGIVAQLGDGVSAFGTALQGGASLMDAFSTGLTAAFGEETAGKVLGVIDAISGAFSTVGEALSTVTEGVGTFLGSLFDGEGLTQSWQNAAEVISGYDWASLGTSILDGVTGAIDTAGAWLSGIFQTGLAAVQGIDWNALGTSIHDGALNLIDSAGAWLSGLFQTGKDAAAGIPWGDIGNAIWSGVTGVLDAAGNFLSGLFGAGKDAAISGVDWGAIGSAIWSGVTGVIDAAGSWLSNLFGFGKSAAEDMNWDEVGTAISGGVGAVLDTAGSWLSAGFDAAKTYASSIPWGEVGTAIQTGVTGVIDTAGTFLSGAFTAAKTAIEGISWGDVGSKISSGLSGALDTLGRIGGSIWDTITGWFSGDDGEKDAQADAEAMMDGLSSGITGGAGAVTAAASTAASGISTAMTNVLSLEGGTAITAGWMTGLSSGITTAQAALTADAQTVADAAKLAVDMALSAENGTTTGTVFMAGVSSGFTTAQATLSANAATVAASASYAASQEMRFSVGSGIGMNMVLGMAAGVRSGASSLYSAITSVASAAVRRARSALRINSPSGVFADDVGAWIPSGIGEGVTRNMEDALGPIEEMRDSMVSVMDGTLSGTRLGAPDVPWSPQASSGSPTTVNINISGDWTVRSEQDKQDIIDELFERIDDERRRR